MISMDFYSPPPLTLDEEARQQAVELSGVLNRRRNPELQALVDEAARYFGTRIAAVSIIDRDRQWFAARAGLDADETPRAVSFCAHAIHTPGEPLVVPDATQDTRFAGNPLVIYAPHIRFYAGVPLVDWQGYALGALCIIDDQPRAHEPNLSELSALARKAEQLIAR